MNKGNWVALDKNAIKTLGKLDRAYSLVEALFSFQVDIDCDRQWSINGYAELWGWSRNKVRKFVTELRTGSGHIADRKGTGKGQVVRFVDKGLRGEEDRKRTGRGQEEDRKRDTTIILNPKPNPKEEKDLGGKPPVKCFQALQYLMSVGVNRQHAEDWLSVRKTKRLATTKTAVDLVISEAKKAGVSIPDIIRICGERGWAGFKSSWDLADAGLQRKTATTEDGYEWGKGLSKADGSGCSAS